MAQKNSGRKKKLGLTILILFIAAILLTVVISSLVTMAMFRNYNDMIMLDRSKVGMQVLENMVDDVLGNLEDAFSMMKEDGDFRDAAEAANEPVLKDYLQRKLPGEHYYMVVGDKSGTITYKSEKYPLKSFSYAPVGAGKTIKGIARCDGELVAMYASYVKDQDGQEFMLCLGLDMKSDEWLDEVMKISDCDATVWNWDIRYATTLKRDNGERATGTDLNEDVQEAVLKKDGTYLGQHDVVDRHYYVSYQTMKDYDGNIIGAYWAGADARDADKEFMIVTIASTGTAVALVIISSIIIFLFVRKRVITPINQVTILADEMERGQLSTTAVDYWFVNDEVGTFARKLRYSKKSLSNCIADISGVLNKMADGDFTEQPAVTYPGDFETIKTSMLKIEDDLGTTLSRMNMSSDEVLSGSSQMAEGSQSLADGTTKQASAIQQISATIQEVSTQIASTAENAQRAGDLSKQTEEKVDHQDGVITNMVEAMNEISDTSKEIEKIIKAIEDISFQTNILALNAAVEAARAGDAGKGFAVVADEVRNLANKSAEAAQSTSSLITASIEAVDKGAKLANSTAESMKEVKQISAETAKLIGEIAEASAEQNDAIKQITSGVDQISQVIQMNSATAEETAASCEELSGQSRLLKDQVSRFRIKE